MLVGSTSLRQMLFVTSSGQLSYDMGHWVNQWYKCKNNGFLESMQENIALIVSVRNYPPSNEEKVP